MNALLIYPKIEILNLGIEVNPRFQVRLDINFLLGASQEYKDQYFVISILLFNSFLCKTLTA